MNTLGYQTWAYFVQKARNYVHEIMLYIGIGSFKSYLGTFITNV